MGAASPTSRKAIVGIGLAIGTPFGFLQFILFLFDSQKIGTSWALLIGLLLFFLVPCSCMYIAQRTEQELTGYELSSIIALSCAAVSILILAGGIWIFPSPSPPGLGMVNPAATIIIVLFVLLIFLNFIGIMTSLTGGAIGNMLGKRRRKRIMSQ